MKDGLGRPQSAWLIGGTSEIGHAILRTLAPRDRIVVSGRPSPALDDAAVRLRSETGAAVEVHAGDVTDTARHRTLVDGVFDAGDIDTIVLAAGVLGDQATALDRPEDVVDMAAVTYLGAMSMALHVGRRLARQGHGDLVILSSVAADRPRPANFAYGSAKAGIDAIGRGLHDALRPHGVEVLVVRPGFVHTRMTAGMPPAPFSVDPDQVASDVVRGLRRRSKVVYSPPILRPVMTAIRLMPGAVVRRLPR